MEKPDFKALGVQDFKSHYDYLEEYDHWRNEIETHSNNFNRACEVVWDDYVTPLESELSSLQEEYNMFKRGIAKGTELYARLKIDDEEFTPYQLALQKIESLKQKEPEIIFKSLADEYRKLGATRPLDPFNEIMGFAPFNKELEQKEKLTEKQFCRIYTAYYGEPIDSVRQLASINFTGEELLEFVRHCFEIRKKSEVEQKEEEQEMTNWFEVEAIISYRNKNDKFNEQIIADLKQRFHITRKQSLGEVNK